MTFNVGDRVVQVNNSIDSESGYIHKGVGTVASKPGFGIYADYWDVVVQWDEIDTTPKGYKNSELKKCN